MWYHPQYNHWIYRQIYDRYKCQLYWGYIREYIFGILTVYSITILQIIFMVCA
jgi:hypothetical protein